MRLFILLLATVPLVSDAHKVMWDPDHENHIEGTTYEVVIGNQDAVTVDGFIYELPDPHIDDYVTVKVRAVAPAGFDCGEPPADGSEHWCPYSDWTSITRYIPGVQGNITLSYKLHDGPLSAFFMRYPFDEGKGSYVRDAASSGIPGILMEKPQFASDTPDDSLYSLFFNGKKQRVEIDNIDISGPQFGVAMWFKVSKFRNKDERLVSQATDTAEQNHVFMVSLYKRNRVYRLRGRLRVQDKVYTVQAGAGDLSPSIWYHAALAYDGMFIRLFLDGAEVGSVPAEGDVTGNRLLLTGVGCQPTDAGDGGLNKELRCLNGGIDEIRLFRSAPNIQEIKDYVDQFGSREMIADGQ